MIALFGYTFEDNKACLICEHVFAGEQIKVAVHDSDGWLQFLCGSENHKPDDAKTAALVELGKRHDLGALPAELPMGSAAEMDASGVWCIFDIQGS